jgi:cytochrome P450
MAIYTVFFGPLAKFPGPPLAAASYVPYAFHLADGTLSEWIKELHEQYNSEVVRISPNDLSFICASAWKDICGPRPGHRPFEKDVAVYGKAPNGIDTLLTAKKQDHSRMRRVLDHAFSTKALKEQEPLILGSIDKLVRCLHNQVTRPYAGKVDLTNWYRWMSFDVTGDLAFGESFNCLESEANHPWVQMVFGNLQGIVFMNACSRFPLFASVLPYLIPSRITKMMDDHWASTKAKLARRIANGTARQDFLSPILENNTDKGLMHGEIESNASLLIIAGSDSVASSITGSTWFLTKHPEVMEKLKDEINQAFSKEADITIKSVDQLPYLAAVVDEVLRIYPVALAGQASIIPPKGDTVAGYWLPGNVSSNSSLSCLNFLQLQI